MAVDFSTTNKQNEIIDLLGAIDSIVTDSAVTLLEGIESAVALLNDYVGASVDQSQVEEFASNPSVPKSSETIVLTYTVPSLKTLRIRSWSAWADTDAEYFLRVDGTQKDGARTSIARPQAENAFFLDSIEATAGQVVTIRALYSTGSPTQPFKATLKGVLDA
jgi:hypothetical protein